MPSRVAVIGSGAAGLVAARELRREGHDPVVFERAARVGGVWLYDSAASPDPLGAGGVHSSLYASLRTNIPRECMGFFDFRFVADESTGDPRRYPGHEEVLRYLEAFARRFDLHGLVRPETEVVRVRRDASAASWRVVYSRKLSGAVSEEEEEEVFDAVVVCNGHFTEPRLASIAGCGDNRIQSQWDGHIEGHCWCRQRGPCCHSISALRRTAEYYCKTQLLATFHELQYPGPLDPSVYPIERAEEDGTIVFQDGSRVKADVVIHCTGYKYSFPFLGDDDEAAGICVDDNRVGPLYKHVFPPQLAPHIAFIGLPFKGIPFPLFQLQSNWVAGVLSGRIKLPSEEKMMHDVETFYLEMEARGCPKRYTHGLTLTFEYEDWLVEQSGLEKIEEWRKVIHLAARTKVSDQPESYRDKWDGDHLLAQAHNDFTKLSDGLLIGFNNGLSSFLWSCGRI